MVRLAKVAWPGCGSIDQRSPLPNGRAHTTGTEQAHQVTQTAPGERDGEKEMFDASLRVKKDRWFHLIVRRLPRVDPSWITLAGLLLGLASCGAVLAGCQVASLLLWIANRTFDGVDGAHARVHGLQSAWGGYLDLFSDLAVYALLPFAMVLARPSLTGFTMLTLLLATFYVNLGSWMMLSALCPTHSGTTSISMPRGLVEGAETVIFYTIFLLFPRAAPALFGLMAALVVVTIAQRVSWAARNLPRVTKARMEDAGEEITPARTGRTQPEAG